MKHGTLEERLLRVEQLLDLIDLPQMVRKHRYELGILRQRLDKLETEVEEGQSA